MPINLSYPKPRNLLTKVFPIGVADSSTEKCWLPKDAVVVGVFVHQTAAATTNPSAFAVGWTGALTGLLNAFATATTSVGYVAPGTAAGAQIGVKQTADRKVISTCTPGVSDTTSAGYVVLHYFVPGPGETATD
jgi:hypothetical protein